MGVGCFVRKRPEGCRVTTYLTTVGRGKPQKKENNLNAEKITIEVAAEMLADASAFAGYLIKRQLETNTVTIDQWELALDACTRALTIYWENQKSEPVVTTASRGTVGP